MPSWALASDRKVLVCQRGYQVPSPQSSVRRVLVCHRGYQASRRHVRPSRHRSGRERCGGRDSRGPAEHHERRGPSSEGCCWRCRWREARR
eukprot:6016671-Pyramimonas_sp.AAC.1